MPVPVLFDSDAGSDIDDLWALALVLAHPEIELAGATTVAGDTQARARLVAKMLRLAGAEAVPVAAGPGKTLAEIDGGEPGRRGGGTLSHTQIVREDDPEFAREYPDAVAFMLDALSRARRPVTIVGTGAWTNIAEVIRRADGRQRSRIGEIALMGGEIHLQHREANIAGDPEAADAVLRSGLPIFMGTWSVTRQLAFAMAEVEGLLGGSPAPFGRALLEATRMWWGPGQGVKPGPVCYDVVPVFWAAGEREAIGAVGVDEVRVELLGRHTRGVTVGPHPWRRERAEPVEATSPGRLAVSARLDAAAMKARYIESTRALLVG